VTSIGASAPVPALATAIPRETLNKYAQLWPSEEPKVKKDFCRNVENLSRKADTEIWLF
jgi:hypothetical protein